METLALFIVMAIFSLFVLLLYLTPTLMAVKHQHQYKAWIITLNLTIGWTLLGWLFVLIWSTRK
ncbi:superinfection immunity protein [Alkalibacillus haloalkaliphilus]|uniref:superinfection immunity protein n=1 Tax=Alkalibacillus haloalkaliphilus TaxID=94136 RepID=UPI0002F88523|nr:superinfection immunity protein [Alkalibacillus haloalkaliphilus]